MPPQLLDLVKRSADFLASHGITNARREAEWIFAESLRLTRMDLYTRFDMPLEETEVQRLRGLIMRRSKREPLAYVLGNQDFMGLRLAVGPGVLVPRPETEELVELALAELPAGPCRVLDIGTGSGAIALAMKRARPECEVHGVDRSESALVYAKANALSLGLDVVFSRGHLADGQSGFDLVLANLPYIGDLERSDCDPELAFEPEEALYAGPDGMQAIGELIGDAQRLLGQTGVLWLEHGWRQGALILTCCSGHGLVCDQRTDQSGKDRFVRITTAAQSATCVPKAANPQ